MKHGLTTPTETDKPAQRSYAIESVVRAAKVLCAFSSTSEVLPLRSVVERTRLNKCTAFRLLETLTETGLLSRVGNEGYRTCLQPIRSKHFRIGYASQSSLLPFTGIVTDSLRTAASEADIDLVVVSNKFSPRLAIENAEKFIEGKVDLVIDSQINYNVAAQIGARFSDAGIPFIAVDIPHPGGIYFGADNYKAGRMAGRYLGRWVMNAWKGEAKQVIYLGVDAAGPLLNSRLTGMHDGLREQLPEIERVSTCYYDTKGGQFETALDTMRRHLRRRKLGRILVGAVNDSAALGALQAFREMGMEEECAIVGQDANVAARQELRKPATRLVASVAYFPENYGSGLIKLALEILEKKRVPPAVFTQHELVTPNNIDRIYPNDVWMQSTQN